MRSIAIANQKGGVGKSTTAINLGVGLAMAGQRVLLIDMDPQANTTFAVLGVKEPNPTVYDVLINNLAIPQAIVATTQERLQLLPSDINLAGAEVDLITEIGGQTRLKMCLGEGLDQTYDYVVIDTPPSLGLLTINALAAVEEIIVPVSASVFALKGLAQLEKTIEKVRANLQRPTLRITGALVTMYDYTNVSRDVLAAIQKRFGDVAFKTVIPKSVKLEEAHSRVQSVYAYAPTSKGAQAYALFVEEVIQRGRAKEA
jgi:chromosome partitioning protein